MDKTGTLTENTLTVEDIFVPDGVLREKAELFASAYVIGSGDTSQTLQAVAKFLTTQFADVVKNLFSFSSARHYGAVFLPNEGEGTGIFVGSADSFLPHIKSVVGREWLEKTIAKNSTAGKRVLTVVSSVGSSLSGDISTCDLTPLCVFVFKSDFRKGVEEAIQFFQDRGVHIRIISGDNVETVRAVASAAGVLHTDKAVTGSELATWSEEDFKIKTKDYSIFARVSPEQKVKIIVG